MVAGVGPLVVAAAGGQEPAVRAERQRLHRPGVALQRIADRTPGSRVPHDHHAVTAAAGQRSAVGAEGHRVHRFGVPPELGDGGHGRGARLGPEQVGHGGGGDQESRDHDDRRPEPVPGVRVRTEVSVDAGAREAVGDEAGGDTAVNGRVAGRSSWRAVAYGSVGGGGGGGGGGVGRAGRSAIRVSASSGGDSAGDSPGAGVAAISASRPAAWGPVRRRAGSLRSSPSRRGARGPACTSGAGGRVTIET